MRSKRRRVRFRLEPGPNSQPKFYPNSADPPDRRVCGRGTARSCPVIISAQHWQHKHPGTRHGKDPRFRKRKLLGHRPDSQHPAEFVSAITLVDSEHVPRLGGLCSVSRGIQLKDGGKWKVAFRVRRLVNVTAIMKHEGRVRGTITEFHRPRSEVVPKDVIAIKSAFAAYAQSNQAYRTKAMHSDYEAERLSAINSPALLSNVLLHHVQMLHATRARLLPLSDAERITELLAVLKPRANE